MELKNRITLLILIMLLGIEMSDAQWKLNSSLHSLVVNGIDCILKHEYEQADSIFNIVIKIFPDHRPDTSIGQR